MIRLPGVLGDLARTVSRLQLPDRTLAAGAALARLVPARRRPAIEPPLLAEPSTIAAHRIAFPPCATPEISVVIPVYGHLDFTLSCLASIVRHPPSAPYEIIVVDDASPDASADVLAAVPGLRLVQNPENLGFIGACNAGAKAARGRFVCFLNNDTQVLPGWMDEMLGTFARETGVGLVGAKLVYPDGRLQEAGGIIWRDANGVNYGRLDDPRRPEFNYARDVDYCSGACITLETSLFRELGGFDAHFAPAYYEDTDLAFRVRQHGLRTVYQPLAEVVHFEGISSGTDLTKGVKKHQVTNRLKFLERWRTVLEARHAPPGAPLLVTKDGARRMPRLLAIDTKLPRPDQDSGSLRMFNLLVAARRLGFHVTLAVEEYEATSFDDRDLRALRRHGIEVACPPWTTSPAHLLRRQGGLYDVVLMSRPDNATRHLEQVRRVAPRAVTVFDTVDLHFVRPRREAEMLGDARRLERAELRRLEEVSLAEACDFTLTVSEHERRVLLAECPSARVLVVSNIVHPQPVTTPFADRPDFLFIGGYKHPPNADAVRWFVAEVLPLMSQRLPDARFLVVGSHPTPEVLALAGPRVVVTGHVEDLTPLFERCRCSVAPLRWGAGVKGKINSSMSYGVPVVASTTAVEGMELAAGTDVLVADEPRAFADAMVRLYEDEALWQTLSTNGRAALRRAFSAEAAAIPLRVLLEAARG
jgi:GT2 family glycosyltransferase/glycosyltransferase involved in cell wall biosynthesis